MTSTSARVDVGDREAVEAALDHDALDALVLAAGTNVKDRKLSELSPESWETLMRANLDGVYHCVRAALPALRKAKGVVVIIGSVSGSWPDISGPAYQATKAAVLAFARGATLEEYDAKTGVRFSLVAPGVVDTPILENRPKPPSAEDRAIALKSEDVAEVCAFLCALPPGVHVPELTVLPTALQALGRTRRRCLCFGGGGERALDRDHGDARDRHRAERVAGRLRDDREDGVREGRPGARVPRRRARWRR